MAFLVQMRNFANKENQINYRARCRIWKTYWLSIDKLHGLTKSDEILCYVTYKGDNYYSHLQAIFEF
jgi:hypothetical protein